MTVVLSLLPTRPVPGLVENHERYAQMHGYQHIVVDGTHIYGERQQVLHRYHCIYQQLQALKNDELLLVLDVFSLIYTPHPLEAVAQGYDSIVSLTNPDPTQNPGLANSSGMIFRNTPEIREKMYALLQELGRWAMYMAEQGQKIEAQILGNAFPPVTFIARLSSGHYPCIQALWQVSVAQLNTVIDTLRQAQPLLVSHAPEWRQHHGLWHPQFDYDFRFVQAILHEAQVQSTTAHNFQTEFSLAAQTPLEPEVHLNPEAEIAFVSLYTRNIAGYGLLHERSMLRYCERHGYGYHVYRGSPGFIPDSVSANWAKAHLIRHHLAQHQFVLWIDADILAVQQASGVEPLLSGRDFIVGMDHTAWAINSCVFGARNTPEMRAFIDRLCQRIEAVENKSSVYASGGDQQVLNEILIDEGMLNAKHVVDAISLGTSPIYATTQHRFVHFPSQINHYRAATMRIWDEKST